MSYYKPGSWNVICQLCGRQVKSDQSRKRWDGLIVCENDYESRHILDFLRPTEERGTVPFTVPEPDDNFIVPLYFDLANGQADYGGADVAKADTVLTLKI